jgi:hypothetical protein
MVTGVIAAPSTPFTTAEDGVTVGLETVKVKVFWSLLPNKVVATTVTA